jgi:hypothetical protein
VLLLFNPFTYSPSNEGTPEGDLMLVCKAVTTCTRKDCPFKKQHFEGQTDEALRIPEDCTGFVVPVKVVSERDAASS